MQKYAVIAFFNSISFIETFQLYFMVSDSISPSTKHLDGLAELYTSNSAAETRYHSTLQLSEVKRQLKDKRFQGLPHNIELHQIP